jgi:alcohol dehydrogenase class IV
MGIARSEEGDQAAASRLVEELGALNRDLAVPSPRAYGLDERKWNDMLPMMAAQALASGSPANNPRVPSDAEIVTLYREAWG